jgi:hypothetical protein
VPTFTRGSPAYGALRCAEPPFRGVAEHLPCEHLRVWASGSRMLRPTPAHGTSSATTRRHGSSTASGYRPPDTSGIHQSRGATGAINVVVGSGRPVARWPRCVLKVAGHSGDSVDRSARGTAGYCWARRTAMLPSPTAAATSLSERAQNVADREHAWQVLSRRYGPGPTAAQLLSDSTAAGMSFPVG